MGLTNEKQHSILLLKSVCCVTVCETRPTHAAKAVQLVEPSGISTANASSSCIGVQLYREDTELLVNKTERANQLRLKCKRCTAANQQLSDVLLVFQFLRKKGQFVLTKSQFN